jgi:hypothetical protein
MELILKIDNLSDFNILHPLLKRLGISFREKVKTPDLVNDLPITMAEKPDFMALAGIWKDKNLDADQLRKEAWGDRM